MSFVQDYYGFLGVDGDASQQQIKDAYRRLALQYHPDRNKDDPNASDKMKALNEAYATLSDPIKRRDYDSLREQYGSSAFEQYRRAHSQEDIFEGSDIEQILQEFSRSFGFRNAGDIFREFYDSGFQTYEYRQPGFIYRGYVYNPVQADESEMPLTPSRPPGLWQKVIRFILKKVFKVELPERGKDLVDVLKVKSITALQGGEVGYYYRNSGKPRYLMIKIPTGIRNGQQIRLTGMGLLGRAGGPSGDLLLKVKIQMPLPQRIRSFFRI